MSATVLEPGLRGLRLCLIGPTPPPAGGMALQTLQLAQLLECEGIQVERIATNAAYPQPWMGRLPYGRAIFRLVPYMLQLWRAMGRNQLVHLMANSGWSWHLFCAPVLWIARLRGVPVVVNYRGGEAESFLKRSAGIVRFSMGQAAALIVPSGFLLEVFGRFGMAAHVVPNIVDLRLFSPSDRLEKNAAREAGSRRVILVARNLEAIYDNATAIAAFSRICASIPDVDLHIAGSGPLEGDLRHLVGSLGLTDRVTFLGRLSRAEMAQALQMASVSLNPSRVDNSPNSVLEAMACGVPVVSTAAGGVPHLVEDGRTALLVPPVDATAMADALLRLLREPELASALAVASLKEVERYSWARVRSLLIGHYQSILSGRHAASHHGLCR